MPSNFQKPRPYADLIKLAGEIGSENVLLNDSELGVVLAGSDENPILGSTICSKRSNGSLNIPSAKFGRERKTRLSDVLAYRDRIFQKAG